MQNLQTRQNPSWCPGCGDYGIQAAVKMAITALNIPQEDVVISTGIGCGSKINQWIETYGFAGLHGRSLPVAMGIKLSNPKLTVLDIGGDGDGYGIGMGHFMAMTRRNIDMTYIVQDNQIYGLTLGQYSPTSKKGTKSPSSPFGGIENPVNPITLALSGQATFVARGWAGDVMHLNMLIQEAIKHRGFALIDVFQQCVSFNKINTNAYFQERVYKLEEDSTFDKTNFEMAYKRALEVDEKLPIGIFYQVDQPIYEDSEPGLRKGIPVEKDVENVDISEIQASLM